MLYKFEEWEESNPGSPVLEVTGPSATLAAKLTWLQT